MKLREILNGGLGPRFWRSDYGPMLKFAGYVAAWIGLHLLLVYELRTGIMVGRLTSTEGRHAAPVLFWIQFAGLALAALFFDTVIVVAALHDRRERKRAQPPKPRDP